MLGMFRCLSGLPYRLLLSGVIWVANIPSVSFVYHRTPLSHCISWKTSYANSQRHSCFWETLMPAVQFGKTRPPITWGKLVEDLFTSGLCSILNENRPTHFHSATNSFSCVDLSLCSPVVIPRFTWEVSCDLYHSYHYPIRLS